MKWPAASASLQYESRVGTVRRPAGQPSSRPAATPRVPIWA